MTAGQLYEEAKVYRKITRCKVMRFTNTSQSKGFDFVHYHNLEAAAKAQAKWMVEISYPDQSSPHVHLKIEDHDFIDTTSNIPSNNSFY